MILTFQLVAEQWASQSLPEFDVELFVHASGALFAVLRFSEFHHSLLRVHQLRPADNLPIVEHVLARSRILENLH